MPAPAHDISAKDFRVPLLLSLSKASGGVALKTIQMEDCYPLVLETTGIESLDVYGNTKDGKRTWIEHWIGRAFVALKSEGLGHSSRRGHWGLTPEGIEVALLESDRPTIMEVEMEQTQENTNTSALSIDEHLYTTLISSTDCFGYFSRGSGVCSGCLLKTDCQREVNKTLREMALALADEEHKDALEHEARERAARAAADASKMEEHIRSLGHTIHRSPGGFCPHCDKRWPEDEKVVWVQEMGEYHQTCFLVLKDIEL